MMIELSIDCSLDNQMIENFMSDFVTDMVYQNVGLSWIIKSNQEITFEFQLHCPSWLLYGTFY